MSVLDKNDQTTKYILIFVLQYFQGQEDNAYVTVWIFSLNAFHIICI